MSWPLVSWKVFEHSKSNQWYFLLHWLNCLKLSLISFMYSIFFYQCFIYFLLSIISSSLPSLTLINLLPRVFLFTGLKAPRSDAQLTSWVAQCPERAGGRDPECRVRCLFLCPQLVPGAPSPSSPPPPLPSPALPLVPGSLRRTHHDGRRRAAPDSIRR